MGMPAFSQRNCRSGYSRIMMNMGIIDRRNTIIRVHMGIPERDFIAGCSIHSMAMPLVKSGFSAIIMNMMAFHPLQTPPREIITGGYDKALIFSVGKIIQQYNIWNKAA